jgi:plastocyanin
MKSYLKLVLIASVGAVFAALTANATTFQVQVAANGLTFTPQNITINVGDTVEWVWVGSGHSTTSGTPGNPDGLWDSGVQNAGFSFSQTFDTAGIFAYYCSPHGLCCGMVGSVTVNQQIDTVTILKAQYAIARSQLTVQAKDNDPMAMLTVSQTDTGTIIGPMKTRGDGKYTGTFRNISNPQMITVTSDLGGSATARVRAR